MSKPHVLTYEINYPSIGILQNICEDMGGEINEVVNYALSLYELAQEAFFQGRTIQVELNGARKSIAPDDFMINSLEFTLLNDSTKLSEFSKELGTKRKFDSFLGKFDNLFYALLSFTYGGIIFKFPDDSYKRLRTMAEKDESNLSGIILVKSLSFLRYTTTIYDDGGKIYIEDKEGEFHEAL